MNRELLLAHFDCISEAPDAIPRLRNFVLDLAVRGKLAEQKLGTERVDDIYLKEPTSEHLPRNWRLLNFGKFCDIQGGNQPPKSLFIAAPQPGYVRLFQIRDLGENPVPTYIPVTTTNRFCREGEILIGRYGASVGKVFWAHDGAYNVALAKFIFPENALLPQFAILALKSNFFQAALVGATRSAQAGFNKGDLAGIDLPLPPIVEQRRIVAKLNELMALCDRLEASQCERETRRDRLAAAAHHHLNSGADAEASRRSARFYLNHLPHLSTSVAHVQQLRQTVLNLAVRGLLTQQASNDDSVPELLKRILAKRERFRSASRSNRQENLSAIQSADEPFSIPAAWRWTRLGNLVQSMTNGIYKPSSFYCEKGTTCIRMYNIQNGRLDFSKLQHLKLTREEIEQYLLEAKDILVNRVNSRELVGKAAIVDDPSEPLVYEAMNIRLRLIEKEHIADYVNIVLRTNRVRVEFQGDAKQAIGQASVSQPQVANIMVPLPPLAEQRRIIVKVEELTSVCDRLEQQLTISQAESRYLLEAVLHHALNGSHDVAEHQPLAAPY